MPDLERESHVHHGRRSEPDAQNDPLRNPEGHIYSGASKRVAVTDGLFQPINGMPKENLRNVGRVGHDWRSSTDLSRGKLS